MRSRTSRNAIAIGPVRALVSSRGHPAPRSSAFRFLQAAGLPDIRFHDLRHTFASIDFPKGANINTIFKMLGHYSAKVPLDVYGHLMPGMQAAALQHLDGVFS